MSRRPLPVAAGLRPYLFLWGLSEMPLSERVKKWRVHHFSSWVREENASALLRKAADSIDELGQIDLQDITFCFQTEGKEFEREVTV